MVIFHSYVSLPEGSSIMLYSFLWGIPSRHHGCVFSSWNLHLLVNMTMCSKENIPCRSMNAADLAARTSPCRHPFIDLFSCLITRGYTNQIPGYHICPDFPNIRNIQSSRAFWKPGLWQWSLTHQKFCSFNPNFMLATLAAINLPNLGIIFESHQ